MRQVDEKDQRILTQIVRLLCGERARSYESGVLTMALCKHRGEWRNLLTKFEFICKGHKVPPNAHLDYGTVALLRNQVRPEDVVRTIDTLVQEGWLDGGGRYGRLPLEGYFDYDSEFRPRRMGFEAYEWSSWPADIFIYEPYSDFQAQSPSGPLVAFDAPF